MYIGVPNNQGTFVTTDRNTLKHYLRADSIVYIMVTFLLCSSGTCDTLGSPVRPKFKLIFLEKMAGRQFVIIYWRIHFSGHHLLNRLWKMTQP